MVSRLWMIILLVLIWLGFSNDYTVANLILGLFICTSCHFLVKHKATKYSFNLYRCFVLLGFILYELIVSSIVVAYDILTPKRKSNPTVMKIDLRCTNDLERTLLANLISLTPGTLSLHIDKSKNQLILHVMFNTETERTLSFLRNTFEPMIMKVFND